MRIHNEFHIGTFGASFTIGRYQKVRGICSDLGNGKHFLMWDFDGISLDIIAIELAIIQGTYRLPTIHIIRSSLGDKYHAYCFSEHGFREALQILSLSESVDKDFLAIGILRGYWTLRIDRKRFLNGASGGFATALTIKSKIETRLRPLDCARVVHYWTALD